MLNQTQFAICLSQPLVTRLANISHDSSFVWIADWKQFVPGWLFARREGEKKTASKYNIEVSIV